MALSPAADPTGSLAHLRGLDFRTPLAEATRRVLADLGAEVIEVEPPGGCAARIAPSLEAGRAGDPEGALYGRAFGLGKRSAVHDLQEARDRERFLTELRGDPQLEARGFFVELPHPRIGSARYDGLVTRFSETPAHLRWAGPTIGHDSFEVLAEILGYAEHEIAELSGVLS